MLITKFVFRIFRRGVLTQNSPLVCHWAEQVPCTCSQQTIHNNLLLYSAGEYYCLCYVHHISKTSAVYSHEKQSCHCYEFYKRGLAIHVLLTCYKIYFPNIFSRKNTGYPTSQQKEVFLVLHCWTDIEETTPESRRNRLTLLCIHQNIFVSYEEVQVFQQNLILSCKWGHYTFYFWFLIKIICFSTIYVTYFFVTDVSTNYTYQWKCTRLYVFYTTYTAQYIAIYIPVSYTHLDVYKRQILDSIRF